MNAPAAGTVAANGSLNAMLRAVPVESIEMALGPLSIGAVVSGTTDELLVTGSSRNVTTWLPAAS